MLKNLLEAMWLRSPRVIRRWTMRVTNTRFTVTAAAIVLNKDGEVLLLSHRFRSGSGWGIPGGFLGAGEQPEAGLRRELREEIGLELEHAELVSVRTFSQPRQVEIVFLARTKGTALPQSMEIKGASWFSIETLPQGLPSDQRSLIKQILNDGAKYRD